MIWGMEKEATAKACREPLDVGKRQEIDSFLDRLENECSPASTLTSALRE